MTARRKRAPDNSEIDAILEDLVSSRRAEELVDTVREAMEALASGRRPRPSGLVVIGLALGVVAGVALWSHQQRTARRGLFSASPLRRLAALGYLSGQPSLETIRLLRDYIRWEPRPALRRRGEAVLKRVELNLD